MSNEWSELAFLKGIPVGTKLVRIGCPMAGEYYIDRRGYPQCPIADLLEIFPIIAPNNRYGVVGFSSVRPPDGWQWLFATKEDKEKAKYHFDIDPEREPFYRYAGPGEYFIDADGRVKQTPDERCHWGPYVMVEPIPKKKNARPSPLPQRPDLSRAEG